MAPNEIRMSDHRVSRDVIFPPFDSKAFYTLHNTLSPHKTISSGLNRSTNGTINTTTEETYSSSENWQLFYQSGRYFLHNYDYGPEFQLGVTKDSWTVPRLIPRSGALGQQWNIERWDDGEEEGKGGSVWRLTNALVGEQQFLGLSEPNTVPAMQSTWSGARWEVRINVSAGKVAEGWLVEVGGMEVAPTPTPSAFTSTSASPTSTPLSSSTSPSDLPLPTHRPPRPSSFIAGIASGSIITLLLLLALLYFLIRRTRKRRAQSNGPAPEELETAENPVEAPTAATSYYAPFVSAVRTSEIAVGVGSNVGSAKWVAELESPSGVSELESPATTAELDRRGVEAGG